MAEDPITYAVPLHLDGVQGSITIRFSSMAAARKYIDDPEVIRAFNADVRGGVRKLLADEATREAVRRDPWPAGS